MNLLAVTLLFLNAAQPVQTSTDEPQQQITAQAPVQAVQASVRMEPFTGKITKNRVRLRLQPMLEGQILKELSKDDLVMVLDQSDDFYAVKPKENTKGYVFRTYVLDGQIIGTHVNVRLEPDTNSPVLCQLNEGDKVEGVVASNNNKWLEINLPESVHFYVAKDFVSRVGDSSVYATLQKKKELLEHKLAALETQLNQELEKPFKEIKLKAIAESLVVIAQNKDFPKLAESAAALQLKMQESYLQKGLSQKQLAQQEISKGMEKEAVIATVEPDTAEQKSLSQEPSIAIVHNVVAGPLSLHGIVKPYGRNVKNAPGEFVLVNPKTNLPYGFLSSSQVDLASLVNKEVTLSLQEKENNNFAYPAYVVVKAE